jgi:hypothetical protein
LQDAAKFGGQASLRVQWAHAVVGNASNEKSLTHEQTSESQREFTDRTGRP